MICICFQGIDVLKMYKLKNGLKNHFSIWCRKPKISDNAADGKVVKDAKKGKGELIESKGKVITANDIDELYKQHLTTIGILGKKYVFKCDLSCWLLVFYRHRSLQYL